MNDELERKRKETIVMCLKYYYVTCLGGLRETIKTSVKIAVLAAPKFSRQRSKGADL
jgi:hypothetical protein